LATQAFLVTTFTVWRHECTHWLQALEPVMQSAAGAALPLPLRLSWSVQHARSYVLRGDARGVPAARQAVALARELGDARRVLFAVGVWARAIAEPGPELDAATAALHAALAAVPDLSSRDRLQIQGALSRADQVRGDLVAALAGRETELQLARAADWPAAIDAAESNVLVMLNELGRHAEARTRGRALLARVDAVGGATEGNLPWVLGGLMVACIALGDVDEARALVPRAHAARMRFDAQVLPFELPSLAIAAGRPQAAARLIGHARACAELHGMVLEPSDRKSVDAAERRAVAELGRDRFDALVDEGRSLDEAAAAALAMSDDPVRPA
jgi:hypothetical protein